MCVLLQKAGGLACAHAVMICTGVDGKDGAIFCCAEAEVAAASEIAVRSVRVITFRGGFLLIKLLDVYIEINRWQIETVSTKTKIQKKETKKIEI